MDITTNTSGLSKVVTKEMFAKAYVDFMKQADENAITGKGKGSRTPSGFENLKNKRIDGWMVSQHFGQGGASLTPYINWYVVSVYYIVNQSRIVIGIEKDRYKKVDEMKHLGFEQIGNKNTKIAVFYETSKADVDFDVLYDEFIRVAEEVYRIGTYI